MGIRIAGKTASLFCLGAAAGCACLLGLACLFAAKPAHEEMPCAPDGGGMPYDSADSKRQVVFQAGISPVDAMPDSAVEQDEDGSDGNRDCEDETAPEETIAFGEEQMQALFNAMLRQLIGNEHAETRIGADSTAPGDAAALKETFMREQFNVMLRRGKWIPATGEGTNLVYITTGSIPPGRVGELLDVQFGAESGSPPYKWRVADNELPQPISLDVYSGRLSGIPVEPATIKFLLEATDSRGARDVAEYVLIIQPEQTLEIVTESLPAAFPGQAYLFQLQAQGGIPPYAWSADGNLDEVGTLFVDPQTGQLYGEICEFSPQVDVSLLFRLSDTQINVSREIVLHVRTELSILDVAPVSVRAGESFEFTCRAAGGTEPYVWGVSGVLPAGVGFSASGVCSGAPSEPGRYDIGLWVQDAEGIFEAAQFALEVSPSTPSVSGFEALLSRNSVALKWDSQAAGGSNSVRIVRSSAGKPLTPSDGTTIYLGTENSCLDRDVGAGEHCYAAFLEENGATITAAPPPAIFAKLPPDEDPFADSVVASSLLHPNAFRAAELPGIVLGPPRGTGLERGSSDVVSLGAACNEDNGASAPYGGSIALEFADNLVWDGPGPDFTIFENVFYIHNQDGAPDPETRFMEPAVVSVSQDGVNWRHFKFDFSPRYDPDTGKLNLRHPYCYNKGFAGVNPVMSNGYEPDPTDPDMSGGDSFDLADVGLEWVRFVRIQSTGDRWLMDDDGDLVRHNAETGAASRNVSTSGFDLDAATAIWMKKVDAGD